MTREDYRLNTKNMSPDDMFDYLYTSLELLQSPKARDGLISLIEEKDNTQRKINHILEQEMEIVREKNYGNGHTIEDIEISGNKIVLTIWYDDWEKSQRCTHSFSKDKYEPKEI
jgi:hypothetical protein